MLWTCGEVPSSALTDAAYVIMPSYVSAFDHDAQA